MKSKTTPIANAPMSQYHCGFFTSLYNFMLQSVKHPCKFVVIKNIFLESNATHDEEYKEELFFKN